MLIVDMLDLPEVSALSQWAFNSNPATDNIVAPNKFIVIHRLE
jgi:hypothetical protein